MSRHRRWIGWCVFGLLALPFAAWAQSAPVDSAPSAPERQSRDNAWWTGPMLANSAATLPQGHYLIEPYLFDAHSKHADGFGSLTYINYGLMDRLTIGAIPVFGYNRVDGGPSASGIGAGDLSLLAQYRLTQFQEGSWLPTISIQLEETFPTGKYDRLRNRPADAQGSGAYTTILQINTQTYFWMPTGRILRMRFNVSQAYSRRVDVTGVSVYGTGQGFRGHAKPGSSFYANAAWEYSLTQNWVLALDLTYRHNRNTRVSGTDTSDPLGLPGQQVVRANSGPSVAFAFAPAIEYNINANLGVLFGTRVILGNRRTERSVTPALAINYVH
ncbi:transporter [Dyella koreensis]|uniref:transporter n=1 Tax=Dyella koreensis TaxID=311235 RepID=UPI0036194CED